MKIPNLLVLSLLLILLVAGCIPEENNFDNKTELITLDGESSHWNLQNYTLKIEGNRLTSGSGELQYKFDDNITNYISFKLIASIGNEDIVLQEMKILSNTGENFNRKDTGKADLQIPTQKNGKPISFLDINKIYGVIEWMPPFNKERKKEYIYLDWEE